jgi:hypothetical protein
MKLAKWLLFAVFLVQVCVALIPFVPFFSGLLPTEPSPRDSLNVQITIFGVQFAILTAYVGFALWIYENEASKRAANLISAINAPKINRLSEHDFYPEFLAAIKRATRRVDIMYLARAAPDATRRQERQRYYEELVGTMSALPRVNFRRIIRNSDSNKQWLSQLLPRLATECPNADVGLLREPGSEEMPLSLSVQLIDSKQTWLVALETHEGSSGYRDIYLESPEFNSAMSTYYDRLWARSECLLNQGRLTAAGQAVVEEFRNRET